MVSDPNADCTKSPTEITFGAAYEEQFNDNTTINIQESSFILSSSEVTFHSLRHTAVTLLKDAGVPQAVVQELIGHDSARACSPHIRRSACSRSRKRPRHYRRFER